MSTGGSPCEAKAVIGTLKFELAYGSKPNVVLVPSNEDAASLSTPALADPGDLTGFVIRTSKTALEANREYRWTYHAIQ